MAQLKSNLSTLLNKEQVVYTKCFCEENVWCLCDRVRKELPAELSSIYAVFISNESRQVPIFRQRAAKQNGIVIWDYHVVLLYSPKNDGQGLSQVYDLDTTLDYPCPFSEYISVALQCNEMIPRYFRVIPAADFLSHFASDRSHMMSDGKWMADPPTYSCIYTPECRNNIQSYISMDPMESNAKGIVMNYEQFRYSFAQKS